jgi:hypothetical protein
VSGLQSVAPLPQPQPRTLAERHLQPAFLQVQPERVLFGGGLRKARA